MAGEVTSVGLAMGPSGVDEAPARPLTERRGYSMYIGVGTLVAILIIVLIIYFIRRA